MIRIKQVFIFYILKLTLESLDIINHLRHEGLRLWCIWNKNLSRDRHQKLKKHCLSFCVVFIILCFFFNSQSIWMFWKRNRFGYHEVIFAELISMIHWGHHGQKLSDQFASRLVSNRQSKKEIYLLKLVSH